MNATMKAGLGAVLPLVFVCAAQGANLLRNADFESVDADGVTGGWNYVPADYRMEESAGMNGTRGMVFRSKSRMTGTPLLQRVRVTPGVRYHYGAWAKTEKLLGDNESCARVCLLWEDNWGRLMDDGCYLGARLKGDTDWRKIEAYSPAMPAGAKWMTIRVEVIGQVEAGATVTFDDAFLEPMEVPPVDRLYCSAYRETAASGKIALVTSVNPVWGRPGLPTTAVFSYIGADGARKTKKAAVKENREVLTVLDVADLAMGESEIAVEAFLPDGASYGRSTLKFVRTAEEVKRHVGFDKLGRTLIDGKPFFPLGMYWSISKPYHTFQLPKMNAETVPEYAKSPFNCIMTYVPPSREVLDVCWKCGVRVVYPLQVCFGNEEKWDPNGGKAQAARKMIADFKDHPAVLAWYLNDERPLSRIENLIGRRELVKECDPDHPSWSVLYQVDQMRDYMPSSDVLGTDPYPIPDGPIGRAYEWADKTFRAMYGIRPMWQVPQAFDWGTFRARDKAKCRMPTRDEMANMAWQNVAGGANGLVFYSYTYMMQSTKTPFEKAWADAKSAAQELKDLEHVLLAGGKPPHFTSGNDKVKVRGWSQDGVRYLLAVNTTRDAVEAAVTADGDFTSVKPLLGAAPSNVAGRVLTLSLAPISQTVLELK